VAPGRRGWAKRHRLLRAADFAPLAGQGSASWGAARRWIALSARIEAGSAGASQQGALARQPQASNITSVGPTLMIASLRFGITVPRRQARRAVARNMVKRVLRESARDALPALHASCDGMRADVLLRLRSPLPDASSTAWSALKRQLRVEADGLLRQLGERLADRSRVAGAAGGARPLAQSALGAAGRTGART
jgi:ribonuclease P protein component